MERGREADEPECLEPQKREVVWLLQATARRVPFVDKCVSMSPVIIDKKNFPISPLTIFWLLKKRHLTPPRAGEISHYL